VAHAMKSTMNILTDSQASELATFLRTYHYSGMTSRFSSNLSRLSSFTGKEYAILAQVMPVALLHLQLDPLTIKAWCLVSEVVPSLSFFFSLESLCLASLHS